MEVRSAAYGHRATFFAPDACARDAALVEWGPREIAVPSGSALDARARVCLNGVRTSEASARAWCARIGASFISCGADEFAFEVSGFSRYRYIDSDDDDDEPGTPARDAPAARRSPQRRGSAGRTPARRKLNIDRRAHVPFPTPARRSPKTERPTVADPNDAAFALDGAARRPTRAIGLPFDDDDDEGDEFEEEDDDELPAAEARGEGGAVATPTRKAEPVATVSPFAPRQDADPGVRSALFADFARTRDSRYDSESVQDEEDVMHDITPAKHSARHVRFASSGKKKRPERVPFMPFKPDEDMMDTDGRADNQLLAGADSAVGSGKFPAHSLPFPQIVASVSAGQEGNFADLSHALGRSFRVGFRGAGTVYKPVYAQTSPMYHAMRGFVASAESVFAAGRGQLQRLHFIDLLRSHCSTWKTEELNPSNPKGKGVKMEYGEEQGAGGRRVVKVPSLVDAFAIPAVVDAFFNQVVDDIAALAKDHPNAIHGHVLFGLLRALYKYNQKVGAEGNENLIARLADWARGPAGTAFDDPIPQQPSLRRALLLMTIGDIDGAVEAATNSGHIRLALIISRALEVPKEDLREDAAAQLATYGLPVPSTASGSSMDMVDSSVTEGEECRRDLLDGCNGSEAISVDERMILLLLAGRIPPVAQYLGLSWYRVFIMELLHGAGSSELSQPERVCAAVDRINKSGIATIAPHGKSEDIDAAYHLLKLYADPTASYPVSSGVYSSRSVGLMYSPLDGRFPWLFHQMLSALVPVATTARASWQLAEAFCAQLYASGLPLWGFYVMCSGSPPEWMLKQTLIRTWPALSVDFVEWYPRAESTVTQMSDGDEVEEERENCSAAGHMGAEQFLVSVLGIPMEWLHEARATLSRYNGDPVAECRHWMATKTEEGYNAAHVLLAKEIFPKAVAMYDAEMLGHVRQQLESLAECANISNWSAQGGLVLDYLRHVADVPDTTIPGLTTLRSMARRAAVLYEQAATPVLRHAVTTIADGILAAERAAIIVTEGDRQVVLDQVTTDLESLPASVRARQRTLQEFKVEATMGAAVANRYAASLPLYSKFIAGSIQ